MPQSSITPHPGRFRRMLGGLAIAAAVVAGGSVATGHYFYAAQATTTPAQEQAVAEHSGDRVEPGGEPVGRDKRIVGG